MTDDTKTSEVIHSMDALLGVGDTSLGHYSVSTVLSIARIGKEEIARLSSELTEATEIRRLALDEVFTVKAECEALRKRNASLTATADENDKRAKDALEDCAGQVRLANDYRNQAEAWQGAVEAYHNGVKLEFPKDHPLADYALKASDSLRGVVTKAISDSPDAQMLKDCLRQLEAEKAAKSTIRGRVKLMERQNDQANNYRTEAEAELREWKRIVTAVGDGRYQAIQVEVLTDPARSAFKACKNIIEHYQTNNAGMSVRAARRELEEWRHILLREAGEFVREKLTEEQKSISIYSMVSRIKSLALNPGGIATRTGGADREFEVVVKPLREEVSQLKLLLTEKDAESAKATKVCRLYEQMVDGAIRAIGSKVPIGQDCRTLRDATNYQFYDLMILKLDQLVEVCTAVDVRAMEGEIATLRAGVQAEAQATNMQRNKVARFEEAAKSSERRITHLEGQLAESQQAVLMWEQVTMSFIEDRPLPAVPPGQAHLHGQVVKYMQLLTGTCSVDEMARLRAADARATDWSIRSNRVAMGGSILNYGEDYSLLTPHAQRVCDVLVKIEKRYSVEGDRRKALLDRWVDACTSLQKGLPIPPRWVAISKENADLIDNALMQAVDACITRRAGETSNYLVSTIKAQTERDVARHVTSIYKNHFKALVEGMMIPEISRSLVEEYALAESEAREWTQQVRQRYMPNTDGSEANALIRAQNEADALKQQVTQMRDNVNWNNALTEAHYENRIWRELCDAMTAGREYPAHTTIAFPRVKGHLDRLSLHFKAQQDREMNALCLGKDSQIKGMERKVAERDAQIGVLDRRVAAWIILCTHYTQNGLTTYLQDADSDDVRAIAVKMAHLYGAIVARCQPSVSATQVAMLEDTIKQLRSDVNMYQLMLIEAAGVTDPFEEGYVNSEGFQKITRTADNYKLYDHIHALISKLREREYNDVLERYHIGTMERTIASLRNEASKNGRELKAIRKLLKESGMTVAPDGKLYGRSVLETHAKLINKLVELERQVQELSIRP